MFRCLFAWGALLLASVPVPALTIELSDQPCLPVEGNVALRATVTDSDAGQQLRLYFRRLNPLGAFYYVEMHPAGDGSYWTVFPKPEERDQQQLTDQWWKMLEERDWLRERGWSRDELDSWLSDQEFEAGEYYVAALDARGEIVGRSAMKLTRVLDQDQCDELLTPREQGWAMNLTIGETTSLQAGKQVFHWLCDGVVTRIGFEGIYRPDEYCRACVIGAPLAFLAPAAVVAGGMVSNEPPRRASEEQP